jgi:hypothetical protein
MPLVAWIESRKDRRLACECSRLELPRPGLATLIGPVLSHEHGAHVVTTTPLPRVGANVTKVSP